MPSGWKVPVAVLLQRRLWGGDPAAATFQAESQLRGGKRGCPVFRCPGILDSSTACRKVLGADISVFISGTKCYFSPQLPRNKASVKDLVPFHISDVSRKWPSSLNNLSSPLHNFLIFFSAFWLFSIDEEVNGC